MNQHRIAKVPQGTSSREHRAWLTFERSWRLGSAVAREFHREGATEVTEVLPEPWKTSGIARSFRGWPPMPEKGPSPKR